MSPKSVRTHALAAEAIAAAERTIKLARTSSRRMRVARKVPTEKGQYR